MLDSSFSLRDIAFYFDCTFSSLSHRRLVEADFLETAFIQGELVRTLRFGHTTQTINQIKAESLVTIKGRN